ncbi:hypothetical protein [Streptomyces xiaopingdaonensis]|uniref:hypothetical protein n=1 Tax=Streptomyces xiaopingdaonensis TaxID=1565415 RepID=UPI0002EA8608|nr:hypothetical protein [Streptomyces xiaopingdaonensis]
MLVDNGSQAGFAVASRSMEFLRNAVQASPAPRRPSRCRRPCRRFGVPLLRGVREVFPGEDARIDRTTTSLGGRPRPAAVPGARRRRLVRGACAVEEGYEVYVVCHACGA